MRRPARGTKNRRQSRLIEFVLFVFRKTRVPEHSHEASPLRPRPPSEAEPWTRTSAEQIPRIFPRNLIHVPAVFCGELQTKTLSQRL